MASTLPLFVILVLVLLAAVPCLALLHTTASVIKNETGVWDLRNEVERLTYNYQLQMHRLVHPEAIPDDELGMVDIVDEPQPAAA